MELYNSLFDIKLKNNLNISITNNEIYIQSLLFMFNENKGDMLVVTGSLTEATRLFNLIRKYNSNTYLFPEDEYVTKKALAVSPEFLFMRLDLLNNIRKSGKKIIISHLNSFIKLLPAPADFDKNKLFIKVGESYNRDFLVNKLHDLGYKKESIVTSTGEYAIRGYVVDIFPIGSDNPIRVEFFDDMIEDIKYFDSFTQRTIDRVEEFMINPLKDSFSNSKSTIIDYLDNPILVYQDKNVINNMYQTLLEQIKYYNSGNNEYALLSSISCKNTVNVDLINNTGEYDYVYTSYTIKNYKGNVNEFISDITLISQNHKTYFYSKNKNLINKIKSETKNCNIEYVEENLNNGFIFNNVYYYSDNDIFEKGVTTDYKLNYKIGKKISNLDNLKIGDYVVHKTNGIGIYNGITTIEKNGIKKDYIYIEYKGNDKLYLPVEDFSKLYKYTSKEGSSPKLNKLNSLEWKKTKAKILQRVSEIKEHLIKLYKEREKITVEPFEKDSPEQLMFENDFEFNETIDQVKATNEIKKDLESTKPMDRLLCGDVGYGKTEVIFRAIFKTVMNSKQVAYLCPTTILSFQQYESAVNRFKNFAINIEVINRYTTAKEAKRIIEDLKSGKIDVIFGTHRLLSKDIEFKDLGLLVVDEEHRFGVSHKERIKELKTNVHVLSVSATPIPRTLQMSLVGIRDLSLIETAPMNRLPVQTYVIGYDEMLIKEVISKEISRNGQVFILYNNIDNMPELKERYAKLLPNVSLRFAHGAMKKEEIQDIMYSFTNHEFDVLIATTIIENGIDIPNANTIVIIDADRFGLSQLYQIRGRVGRSDRMAYAYLMYDNKKILSETATKRLDAIKEFTELGSGYKISMRDLAIRGAGDILGSEQAGFIDSVGVDMYLELINGEEEIEDEARIDINDVSTHISEKYTDEDQLIIELHQKINSIKSIEDMKVISEDIIDRFGYLGDDLKLYMYEQLIESLIGSLNIILISNDKMKIKLKLPFNLIKKLSMEKLFVYAAKLTGKFNFEYKSDNLYISLNKVNLDKEYQIYLIKLLTYIKNYIKTEE